jgi:protein-S-isoprenylcysteine O-methyltransferase Ste14/uncharacterized protein YndB with AHSA1/START domain
MKLALKNLLFTLVVPGLGGVYGPWLILRDHGATAASLAWPAVAVIAVGVALYVSCVWVFAVVGGGTPGVWDPPRRVVAVGPYRRVRNPIYLSAMLIVLGEAWLFRSTALLVYAVALAVAFQLLVVAYEEPRLRAKFGDQYESYRGTVPRWIPGLRTTRRRVVAPISSSFEIARPPEDVYAYVTDPTRFPEWQRDVVRVEVLGDGAPGVGTRFVTTRRIGPAERMTTQEVTQTERPRSWAARGVDGPFRPNADLTIEPLDGGTRSRVTISLDFQGHGFGKLLPLEVIRRMTAKTAPKSYQNLKRLLEQGG